MTRRVRVVAVLAAAALVAGCGDAVGIATGRLRIYTIPSGAMENTLRVGDRVAVDTHAPLHRGSIVIFTGPPSWQATPNGHVQFVKRVIGIGGDHVVCCDWQGRVTVNGVALVEPYIYPGVRASDVPFDVTVAAGRLWVMGDRRDASADSRIHLSDGQNGTVPRANVVGVVVKIVSPHSRARPLPTPVYPGLAPG